MEGKQILPTEVLSVKIKFNEDIRRLSCSISSTLEQLRTEVIAKYGIDPNGARLCLKYEDEEGDLVTLGSDADLKEAIKFLPATKLLRLTIVKGKHEHQHKAADTLGSVPSAPVVTSCAPVTTTVASAPAAPTATSIPTAAIGNVPVPIVSKEEFKRLKQESKDLHKHLHKHLHKEGDKTKASQLKDMKRAMKDDLKKQKEALKAAKAAKNIARFVKDVGTPDESEFAPGTPFVKTWRFRNEGASAWPENCQLIFVSKLNGDQMGAPASVPVPSANVGQEIDISVPMIAPTAPGRYVGYWRLCSADGKKFGQRVRVLIQVTATSSSSSDSSSCSSSEDEELVLAPALQQMAILGFTNKEKNIRVLKKHNGDLESAVACLKRKQERMAEKKAKEAEKMAKRAEKMAKKAGKAEKADKAEKLAKKAAKEAEKSQKKAKSATNTPRV